MSDKKIFKDLEGILDWVKKQEQKNNVGLKVKTQKQRNNVYLHKFLKFLNFEFQTDRPVIKFL